MTTACLPALLVLLALAGPVSGQSAPLPTFEIADVRAAAPRMNLNAPMSGGAIRNSVYELRNATMLDLIRTAYSVETDKIFGGPTWLEIDRFDVAAKVSESTTVETARLMLQRLLAERFALTTRQDARELTTWVLSKAAGGPPTLVRAQNAGIAPGCQAAPEPPNVKAVCRNLTIARFVENLPGFGGSYMSGTITDATGLTGAWDFDFVFTNNRARLADAGAQGISLFDALEKQLGLKLEHKTITTTGILVERVNRAPTANASNIEARLPPRPPAEFEVADIKPGSPGAPTRSRILRTGTIDTANIPLRGLISIAWSLIGPEQLAGPKWIDTTRFDVVGRAFTGADAESVDDEFLRLALRKLLVDRFQITFHYEDRPINAYALQAGNVKMTKADPASRMRCLAAPPPGAKDPREGNPTLAGVLTCQNVTMAFFAERLRFYAPGYFAAPIAEMTGLDGGWDFTLTWSPIDMFPNGVNGVGVRGAAPADAGAGAGGGNLAAAPAPSGAITLPEAVERQLGLKLQMGKRPMPVLVIDQISEKPTSN